MESLINIIASMRRMSIALVSVIFIVLKSTGVDVPEDLVQESVASGFTWLDGIFATYTGIVALISKWKSQAK
jgi:hypothetical protein